MAETGGHQMSGFGGNMTGNGQNTNVAQGFMQSGVFGAIAQGVGGIASKFPTPNADLNSNNQMASGLRDGISSALLQSGNPYAMAAGAAVKIIDKTGGFTDASKGLGSGADIGNMAASFLLPGAGWFVKPTDKYNISHDMELMQGGYKSAMNNAQEAAGNSGAKILFGRKTAASNIDVAKSKDNLVSNIKNQAEDSYQSVATTSQTRAMANKYQNEGGYSQALARVGKFGMRIERAKQLAKLTVKPVSSFKEGGSIEVFKPLSDEERKEFFDNFDFSGIASFAKGGQVKEKSDYEKWVEDVNKDYLSDNYDLEAAFKYLNREDLDKWKLAVNSDNPEYYMNYKDANGNYVYHLGSIAKLENGDYMFLKKGNEESNPEVHFETDTYHNGTNGLKDTHDLVFDNEQNRYFYKKKQTPEFKEGGQMNVIPDGNLHARLHHMENADELTKKGIPVVDNEGNQQAEIEVNEIIFNLEVTKKLEELIKDYNNSETKQKDKDNLAIEAGKLIAKEIMENTDDKTGLINKTE